MFTDLFLQDSYGHAVLVAQISLKLLFFAYIGTSIVAILFGLFLWKTTRKLSSFYLLLISVLFGIWCLLNLSAWVGNPKGIMFSWSVLDVFLWGFLILSYWFLYSFIKNKDLPLWQKLLSIGMFIPTFVITVTNFNLDTFSTAEGIAFESNAVNMYRMLFELFFILMILFFTLFEYQKATDRIEKKKIAFSGLGVFLLVFMFEFWSVIALLVEYFNFSGYAETSYYYNFEIYGLFGMPILLAFLGYLIMKYQAFDLKPIKSVMLVIMLMLILFVSVFV